MMRTWFRGPVLPSKPTFKLIRKRKKSGKEKKGKDKIAKVNSNDTSVETEEIPTPTVPQGAKHMTLPSVSKEMDPKRAAALLERRRVSASVSEIRDLYSALQELVPGSGACSLLHRGLPEEDTPTGVSSNPDSPRSRRRSPNGAKETRNLPRSPISEEESSRVRRLLPVTPQSPSSLRKLKTMQTLDVNANHSPIKGKHIHDMDRRGSSGEVLLTMQANQTDKPSPNMGRRGSSGEILTGVRANRIKAPKSPLAMQRSASSQDIYRAVQSQPKPKSPVALSPVKLDRLVSPEALARRGSEGVLHTTTGTQRKQPSPLKMRRRGSSGDILSSEYSKTLPIPRSPLVSQRNDATLDAQEPHSQGTGTDSSPKRGTLMNKLTKFSHSLKKKRTPSASPEPREASPTMRTETNESINQCDAVDGSAQPKKLNRLESQMDLLLNSLNDLQGSSKEPLHASVSDPLRYLDQRRGSVGTEMQELLGALQELSAMVPGSDSDSLGDNEPRSRGESESHDRVPVQRESLDQLEAYFTEKLRDATKAEASKTPSERSSESEAPHSDKEDGEVTQPSSELSNKKTSLEVEIVDEGIDVVDLPAEVLPTDSEVKRPQLMDDRDEVASQVNKKLQDWLGKAMTLAQKEKKAENGNLTTSESEEPKYDSLDSDESDGNKEKGPKKLRRNLFSKLSFLRRGDRSRGKYKHRRSRSMHDVTFSLESERQFQDGDAVVQPATETAQSERKPRRPSTMTRSRSLYNDPPSRNKNRRKQVKEAEDVPSIAKDLEINAPVPMPEQVLHRSHIETSSSKDFGSADTTTATEKPKVITSPSHQKSGAKNMKRLTPKKRLGRLPTDLPFFYTPEAEKSCQRQENIKQTNVQSPLRNKQKLLSQNGVIYTGMEESFYTEKPNENRKLKKTVSNTLPRPRILVNESSNCFFENRIESEVTFFYPAASPSLPPLRRFASVDSFLSSKDLQNCEAPETNGSSRYGNELLADDAAQNNLPRTVSDEQSRCPSPPANVWEMEVTI